MPLLNWGEHLSVGVSLLDHDHKKLLGMLNDLYDEIRAGHAKESVGKTLDSLIAYTKVHFYREERFFDRTDYPGRGAHKKEHEDLTRQVLAVQRKYLADEIGSLSIEVLFFLKNWLVKHIQVCDKQYGPHFNAKGIH